MKTVGIVIELLHAFRDHNIEIFTEESAQYREKIKLSNTLKSSCPLAIVYCESSKHIQICLSFAKKKGMKFRIRSGGHNHEGFSSADRALVIDISKINTYKIIPELITKNLLQHVDKIPGNINALAIIGAGCRFGKLYNDLANDGYFLSGGGCESVSIGGFVQGGGWGPYSRLLGMGCDNVLGVHTIKPDGSEVIYLDKSLRRIGSKFFEKFHFLNIPIEFSDDVDAILYAIRGGGGGNFGVVLHILYRIFHTEEIITEFTFNFHFSKAEEVTNQWLKLIQKKDNTHITSACRIAVSDHQNRCDARGVIIVGKIIGDRSAFNDFLATYGFEKNALSHKYSKTKLVIRKKSTKDHLFYSESSVMEGKAILPDQLLLFDSHLYGGLKDQHESFSLEAEQLPNRSTDPSASGSTCDRPHPHKVSSCFPKSRKQASENIIKELIEKVGAETYDRRVNKYISLHGMGGNINNMAVDSSMPYKDRDFIVQIQAWWDFDYDDSFNNHCIAWVAKTREKINKYTEGAFINFLDKSIIPNSGNEKADKEKLMKMYYGKHFDDLVKIKNKVDPHAEFDFEMSIPNKKT